MSTISKPNTFSAGATITAASHNENFDTIYNDYNGNVTNANISASAAIANSKLNLSSISQAVALAGGLTMSSKQIDEAKGADVASAGTTTIWVTDGNYIHITGTTTITSFGTAAQAGAERIVVFDGALTLTHNATSLILPTGANITTAAGDVAIVRAETTANARVINYYRKDGTALVGATVSNALSGSVIQTVNTLDGTLATISTVLPIDNSLPSSSEGTQILSLAITPNNASNNLLITVVAQLACAAADKFGIALFNNANTCIKAVAGPAVSGPMTLTLQHYVAAGATSALTFKVRAGRNSAGNIYFNGDESGTQLFTTGTCGSSITIQEIKA